MQLSATELIFSHLLIASAINYFVGLVCETNSTIRILNETQCSVASVAIDTAFLQRICKRV